MTDISATSPRRWRPLVLGLLLVLAAIVPELPALHGQFQWDDEELHIQPAADTSNPFTFFSFGHASATHAEANYYPLSMLGFWCEYRLFGKNMTGYHLVNMLLHAANVLLAWLLLRRLRVPWAFVVALVFALHPMMVETVAYISELKNLLSGFFFLSAAHLWLFWSDARGRSAATFYVAIFMCFLAAMLAKSTACTFPAVVLLIDWIRRPNRLRLSVLGALPLLCVAAVVVAMFIHAEHSHVGATGSAFQFSALDRLLIASRAAWFYAGKFLLPWPLLTVYPRWVINPTAAWQYLYVVGVIALPVALWALQKRTGLRPLLTTMLFLVLISPSLGFVVYYPMLFTFVADHYLYLAAIPLAALYVGTLRLVLARIASVTIVQPAAAMVLAALLAPLTCLQSARWQSDITLWQPTVARNPDSWYATANLAYAYAQAGKYEEARQLAARSLTLNETNSRAHFTLALALLQRGDPAAAAAQYARGLTLESTNAVAWLNDGIALERLGNLPAAAAAYARAAALDPRQPNAWNNLAVLQIRQGDWSDALASAQAAVRADPDYAPACVNLAFALEHAGRISEAAEALRHGLSLLPSSPRLELELIRLLLQQNDIRSAVAEGENLLRTAPDSPEAARTRELLAHLEAPPPAAATAP